MRTLVVQQHDTVTNGGDLWTLDIASKTLRPLVRTPADEWGGRLSPDGRWLAYFSNVSGRYELYVTSFPARASDGKCRRTAGARLCGRKMDASCSFGTDRNVLVAAVRPGATFAWDSAARAL